MSTLKDSVSLLFDYRRPSIELTQEFADHQLERVRRRQDLRYGTDVSRINAELARYALTVGPISVRLECDGHSLITVMKTYDRDDPTREVRVMSSHPWSPHVPIQDQVESAMREMWEHEFYEGFKRDGRRVRDLHATVVREPHNYSISGRVADSMVADDAMTTDKGIK